MHFVFWCLTVAVTRFNQFVFWPIERLSRYDGLDEACAAPVRR
jgi:hypothetical protein